jgi:Protein of unknown function (DUF992)
MNRCHLSFGWLASACVSAFCLLGVSASPAQEQLRVGTLSCDVSAGVGLIFVQKQALACTFKPDGGGPFSRYTGQIAEYGLALGGVEKGHLIWGVIAATRGIPPGALAGEYAGAGAEAAAGVGLGANALIGGTGRAFSLQPISVEGEVGLNVAAGVTRIILAPAF